MRNWFNSLLRMCFGTPQRLLGTLLALLAVLATVEPEVATKAIRNIITVFWPFIQFGLTMFFIALGLRMMWRGVSGGGGSRRRR